MLQSPAPPSVSRLISPLFLFNWRRRDIVLPLSRVRRQRRQRRRRRRRRRRRINTWRP